MVLIRERTTDIQRMVVDTRMISTWQHTQTRMCVYIYIDMCMCVSLDNLVCNVSIN